ncbi:hypothetical protein L7F22_034420 [Adiantum nelumboides]|nr:hypothetical protein [Adiantum nelumboides]
MYLNMSDGEQCLSLNAPDIEILRNPKAELSDTFVYAGITVVKLFIPKESHSEIFILHAQLGEKLRDMNHPQEALIKWFTYCCPMETTTIVFPYCHSGHWSIVIFEVDKRIVWTQNSIAGSHPELPLVLKRLLVAYRSLVGDHSLYDSEIKVVPVKEQTDSVSCGWRCILHAEYILHALFDHKEHFMVKSSDHFRYVGSVPSKSVENAPLFPNMGDIELMPASGEGGVAEGVAPKEMEEQGITVEAENVDAPSLVEDVCLNQMEELGATREEAAVGVPPMAYEVPVQNKEETNMDAATIQEEIGGTREQTEGEVQPMTDDANVVEPADAMQEVGDTREQPKVEVLPMTDNVVVAEPAKRIEEVGVTKEEQELGVSPIIEHMTEEKPADQQHPIDPTVQEKPEHSNQPEMAHEQKDTTKEQEHQNKEDEEDQQSTVKDSAFDKSPQLHGAN